MNGIAFLAFTIDFLVYWFMDRDFIDHRILSLFSVAGGGVGMLLTFLVFDRRAVKRNVAWRFMAIIGIVIWTVISLCVYGIVSIDVASLVAPLELGRLVPIGVYILVMSAITFCVFIYDKRQAEHDGWRVREFVLLGLSLAGGALGGIVAMHLVRHKTHIWYFVWGLPFMVVLQLALVVWLRLVGIV